LTHSTPPSGLCSWSDSLTDRLTDCAGFELLESIAFSGVALNLVVYLGTVLHGTTAFNAAHVDTWNGTTFIVPVIGAFLADSCWGKYNTIVASLLFYLAVSILPYLIHYLSPAIL
jgi:peptide/histidine transporter 3/4